MNLRPSAKSKIFFVFLLAILGFGAAASAATFTIYIDSDNNTATGCTSGPFNGIEQILITTVDATPAVTSVQQQTCTGGVFGPVTPVPPPPAPPWPVGSGNGLDGTNVTETYLPFTPTAPVIRLYLAADGGDTLTTTSGRGGAPILYALPFDPAIPTLGEWGLLLLALGLAGAAFFSLRRRQRIAFLLLCLLAAGAGAAWALITLDGMTDDWNPGDKVADDAFGSDPSPDLRALFVRFEGGRLFFRIDGSFNRPPIASNDSATVLEDSGATTIDVRANDLDPEGDPFTIGSVTQPANGTVVITNGGADLTYTPNPDYCNNPPGTTLDTFTYKLSPGVAMATVTVTVTCVDDAPTAVDDSATVAEDSGATAIDVLANDTDPDGGTKLVTAAQNPSADGGTVLITGGGTGVTYQPAANYCNNPPGGAPDTFTYTITGGSTATVSVTVNCSDDPPTAVDDAATVDEDSGATAVDVLANDTDPDGGTKLVNSVQNPSAQGGTVLITGGGTGVTYQPAADYCNTPPGTTLDTFTYTLTPGGSTATVTVTVTCINDAPVVDLNGAAAGTGFAASYTEGNAATPIVDAANATVTDVDNANLVSLTVTITNLLDSGFETLAANTAGTSITALYTPGTGVLALTGSDTVANYQQVLRTVTYVNADPVPDTTTRSITFVANDGTTNSNTATATVTVTAVDSNPTAVDDAATVAEDSGANAIDVLANDTDPDGGTKLVNSVQNPSAQGGTVLITGGGTGVTYQPAADYCNNPPGTTLDTFTYTLTPGGSTATVTVTVTCVDDPPVVDLNGATAGTGFAASYTEGNAATPIVDAANATVTDVDSANLASLTVTITNLLDSGFETLAADTTGTSITALYTPGTGVLALTGSDTVANYQQVLRTVTYVNTDADPDTTTRSITFVANDGTSDSNTATATVTITAVDTDPTAVDDAATVVEDSGANAIDVLANDTDPDGGTKLVNSVQNPSAQGGTVLITGGGTGVTYAPAANYCNNPPGTTLDTFTYTLTPGGSTATVTVTVTCVDDDPVAVDDSATVVEDSGANAIDVLANDTDVDGGTKLVNSVQSPSAQGGTVLITGGGTGVTYAPAANYCNNPPGTTLDTFTYTLTPGGSTATVTVTVTCVDDAPVAVDDSATVVEDSGANAIDVLANDTDVDGGTKLVNAVQNPSAQGGTVLITGGGTGVTYAPAANYCNNPPGTTLDTFTYTLTPGGSTATVTVTVTCVDDDPVAVNDAATVVEDSGANAIDVLANDTDVDGGTKLVNSVQNPSAQGGTVLITGGGTGVTYAPAADYCNNPPGTTLDTFTYTLTPGGSTATVTVTVTCVDDPPVAVNDAATVVEDSGANAIDVLANDTDVDGGTKLVNSVQNPSAQGGTVLITGGGTGVTYAPAANYCNNPPGTTLDTFTYTLTPGGSTATVTVTVTCVNDPPVADNDSFDFIGNTQLEVDQDTASTPEVLETTPSTFGVLDGDSDPVEGDAIAVSSITVGACTDSVGPTFDCSDAAVGTVHMQANGRFSFEPAPGDTGATETFTYVLTDNGSPPASAAPATVTLTRFERVWYVKNNATAGGLGRSFDPFDTLAEAQTASLANDYIFVYFGDGTTGGQDAGILLKNGQHLIGEHAGLSIPVNLNGNGSPTNLVAAAPGSRPLLDDTTVGSPEGVAATDAIPTEIVGLNLAGNVNGIDLTTNAAFSGSGMLEIRDNVIRSSGNEGMDINLAGSGSVNLKIHDNNVTAGSRGIDVLRTAGTCTISAFDDNVIGGNTGASGIEITGVIFDATPGNPINQVAGGVTVIGQSGNGVGTNGMLLTSVTGDLAFTDLDIFNDAGTGLGVSSTGALNAGAGTGFKIGVGAGVSTIVSNGGPAVSVSNASVSLPINSLTSTNSSTTGLSLVNAFGGAGLTALSAGAGQISDPGGASGTAVNISGGNGNITLGIPITNSSGNAVVITGRTGDTVEFTGAIAETGSGISLTTNTGATMSFRGGLSASTGSNPAFTATGGGTVEVCDENPCSPGATGALVNTLTTTTGTALNVASTTISSNNLEFRSITSDGGGNSGIVLNNTGSSGGLQVKGNGGSCTSAATCTGGAIQNKTVDGVSLTTTRNVSLTRMFINNNDGSGISGTSVTNLTLNSLKILNNTDALVEAGLKLTNLFGVNSVTDTEVGGSTEDNVNVTNNTNSSALTSLTFSGAGCSIHDNSAGSGNVGINIQANLTAAMNGVVIDGCTFQGNRTIAIRGDGADTSQLNITAKNNVITAGSPNQGNQGIEFSAASTAQVTYSIDANKIGTNGVTSSPLLNTGIDISGGGSSTMTGTVTNNTVVNAGAGQSGFGIRVFPSASAVMRVRVQGNTVSNVGLDYGIFVGAGQGTGSTSQVQAGVINNSSSVLSGALDAIRVESRQSGTMCARISGNTTSAGGNGGGFCGPGNANFCGIFVRQANTATFSLETVPPPPLGSLNANQARQEVIDQDPAAATVGSTAATNFTGVAANFCSLIP